MTFVAALVLVPPLAMGGVTYAPITMNNDCATGEVSWEYTNNHPGLVTIRKQRMVLPSELGLPIDTTLSFWNEALPTGESWGLTYPGIIYIEEGEPIDGEPITAMPDGTYSNHVWLTDGVTNWFVKQTVERSCGVSATPQSAILAEN